MLYFGLFLGVIIYTLMDFNSFKGNFLNYIQQKNNVITIILNAIVGVALVVGWKMDNTMLSFIGIAEVNFLTALIFGIIGHSLIEKIVKSMDRKSETKLGLK